MTTDKDTDDAPTLPPVKAVPPEELDKAIEAGKTDPGWQKMRQAEMDYIRRWRARRAGDAAAGGTGSDDAGRDNADNDVRGPENLTGLALSGGGIRSATFSLGVMQALAHRGLLKRMDYLSTVSGGGYIGSAISWLVSDAAQQETPDNCGSAPGRSGYERPRPGMDAADFPFGCDHPAPNADVTPPPDPPRDQPFQKKFLRYLREHGYYLTPGAGINAFSLLGVVLRGTLLNLLVWIPVFVMFFTFGLWASDRGATTLYGDPKGIQPDSTIEQKVSAAATHWGHHLLILPRLLDSLPVHDGDQAPAAEPSTAPPAPVNAATEKTPSHVDEVRASLGKLFGFEFFLWIGCIVPALLLLTLLIYSLLTYHRRGVHARNVCIWYDLRRQVEKATAVFIPVTVATLIIGTLPVVGVWLHGWMVAGGPAAVAIGTAMTLRYFFSAGLSGKSPAPGLMVSIGAALLLYGVALVAYEIAYLLFTTPGDPVDGETVAWVLGIGAVWTYLFGWHVNLNYIGVHRYYRDRLMESFMPDIDRAQANETGQAIGADTTPLHRVANPQAPNGPYHIVNTAAILVNSRQRTYRHRGADNFILSPLYCGSNATGWTPTEKFMEGKMTLATAIAISGAAVNPNSGVGGKGLTRNKTLSLVMSLLNIRLSYWASNPRRCPGHSANHLIPGSYSFGNALGIRGTGFNEERDFIQISDGGQFENNAVYELVRRRLRLIIVCDGGEDGKFTFSDLQDTVERVQADFGAQVTVNPGATPDQMVPKPAKRGKQVYPKDFSFAERGYMVCSIAYNDGSSGTLLFLKTTLIKDVSFRVKAYAAQNQDFPDQSTADQFFDEVQFEAYRELGYQIAMQMLDAPIPSEAPDSSTAATEAEAEAEAEAETKTKTDTESETEAKPRRTLADLVRNPADTAVD